MTISDVQEILKKVIKTGHHKNDPELKKLFTELGALIVLDRVRPQEIVGFPDLNPVSEKTLKILNKIDFRCYQGYDFSILP